MINKKLLKNYAILVVIFIFGIGATLYLCNWYKVYDEYEKQTPIIRGTLSEITNNELEHYILENPTITIYMCTSSADICRNYEKGLKKVVQDKSLTDSIVYMNLSDIDQNSFIKEFNEKYPYKIKLTSNYPALVTFEEGKIKSILQGSEQEKLTITKTKQYLELNHI